MVEKLWVVVKWFEKVQHHEATHLSMFKIEVVPHNVECHNSAKDCHEAKTEP